MNSQNTLVASATTLEQATFYKKTYSHVAFAVLAFIMVETLLIQIVPVDAIAWMLGGKFIWQYVVQ